MFLPLVFPPSEGTDSIIPALYNALFNGGYSTDVALTIRSKTEKDCHMFVVSNRIPTGLTSVLWKLAQAAMEQKQCSINKTVTRVLMHKLSDEVRCLGNSSGRNKRFRTNDYQSWGMKKLCSSLQYDTDC